MTDLTISTQALLQTGGGALVALMLSALLQRWPRNARQERQPTLPPPLPVAQAPRAPMLGMAAIAMQFAANDGARRIITDAKGRVVVERAPRHRHLMAHAKIIDKFMCWMIAEGYSGWYTPELVYEAFQDFAWEHALEEIDYRSFLSYLLAQPGVQKKRAYVQKNETFRHLRGVTAGKERAVVYRIPTAPELAATKHKAALAAAEAALGRPLSGRQKVRLTPGRPEQARHALAELNRQKSDIDYSALNMDDGGRRMAAVA